MARHPELKWAQRSDKVFLSVELPDAKEPKVKIEPEGKFTFAATLGAENEPYEVDLDLFGAVNVEDSKIRTGLRHVICVLAKSEKGWWKRLLKAEGKPPQFVKVDWDKWVDEDEEDEATDKLDKFDLGGMDDFSGFNEGADIGDDGPDSDDEDAEAPKSEEVKV